MRVRYWSGFAGFMVAAVLCACDGDPPTGPEAARLAAIAAGGDHTCGLTRTGAAYCWGANGSGQLGLGATEPPQVSSPAAVRGGLRFQAIAAGGFHTCGLTRGGAAYCWGANEFGQLGTDAAGGRTAAPTPVAGGLHFTRLTLGGLHTCGLTGDGAAYCWGINRFGELGTGSTDTLATRPGLVTGGFPFSDLDAGASHTCGTLAEGAAYCWGYDQFGQLGLDAPGEECGWRSRCGRSPVKVSGLPSLLEIDTGGLHTCGLAAGGRAYCWGLNLYGELGGGDAAMEIRLPVEVAGAPALTSLSLGEHGTCGIARDGSAYCWGHDDYGELGRGGSGPKVWNPVPAAVEGRLDFIGLSAGMFHVCGVTNGGVGYCWGRNQAGQLGDGTYGESRQPVRVRLP